MGIFRDMIILTGGVLMRNKKTSANAYTESVPQKRKLPLIAGTAAAIVLIVLILLAVFYFLGPKKAVKKYVRAGIGKNGGKKYFSMILPDYVVNQLKSDEKWDDMIERYNDDNADARDDYKLKIKKIDKKNKLSGDALDGAKLYFAEIAKKYDTKPQKLTIKKGWEFKITLNKKVKKKSKTTETLTVCAVNIKGEGWKIAEVSASELEDLSTSQS